MILSFCEEWRLNAEGCGRLAAGAMSHGDEKQAYSAGMCAFHFARLILHWQEYEEKRRCSAESAGVKPMTPGPASASWGTR